MTESLQVIQIGNFRPEHSTENHLKRALVTNGHHVLPMQENDPHTFSSLAKRVTDANFVLWTRTGWEWDKIYPGGERQALDDQRSMLDNCRNAGIPVVAYHLDIWHGLKREHQLDTEPFFQSTVVITADGGHEKEWKARGINHVWYPPAVSEPECVMGRRRSQFESPLAFVGSWQGGYHEEHQHRFELIQWLQQNFRRQCKFWPRKGEPAIRGKDLQDLYRSVDLVIGDSCFAGQGVANYWSDRIPETVGRGGLLAHPDVPGLERQFLIGRHLLTWEAGNWTALGDLIDVVLSDKEWHNDVRHAGQQWVLKHHTYEVRMRELVALLKADQLL